MDGAKRNSSPNESQFEQWLTNKLYRADCIDSLTLCEYVADLLHGKEKRLVDAHLARCSHCRKEVYLLSESYS
jgi:anti-sigma factor RsiW